MRYWSKCNGDAANAVLARSHGNTVADLDRVEEFRDATGLWVDDPQLPFEIRYSGDWDPITDEVADQALTVKRSRLTRSA